LQGVTATQMVRHWKSFPIKVSNKTSFIVHEWRKEEYRAKLQEKVVYETANDKCYSLESRNKTVRSCQLFSVALNKTKPMAAYFSMLLYREISVSSDLGKLTALKLF